MQSKPFPGCCGIEILAGLSDVSNRRLAEAIDDASSELGETLFSNERYARESDKTFFVTKNRELCQRMILATTNSAQKNAAKALVENGFSVLQEWIGQHGRTVTLWSRLVSAE